MKHNHAKSFFILFCIFCLIISLRGNDTEDLILKIKNGTKSGKIAYKLTEPEEIKALVASGASLTYFAGPIVNPGGFIEKIRAK